MISFSKSGDLEWRRTISDFFLPAIIFGVIFAILLMAAAVGWFVAFKSIGIACS